MTQQAAANVEEPVIKASAGEGTYFPARALKDDQKSPVTEFTYIIHHSLFLHLTLFSQSRKIFKTHPTVIVLMTKWLNWQKTLIRSLFHSHNYLNKQQKIQFAQYTIFPGGSDHRFQSPPHQI